jgi:hypothetical protein
LGADLAEYRLARASGGFLARNARQGLTASFSARGATVSARDGGHVSIALQAIGFGAALHVATRARPLARDNRVEYRRGVASEWFANGPAGVEQGFTIQRKPTGATERTLRLVLGVSGSRPARHGAGGSLLLAGAGPGAVRYGDLRVSDASGRVLPAHLSVERGRVLISVDASRVRYPLTVDPLLSSLAELYASDGVKEAFLGSAVAVSGNTIVVGDPSAEVLGHARAGAAYVFTEGPSGWASATQSAKLIASDAAAENSFGASVAISGATIVVGAWGRSSGSGVDAGAAYVYTEPVGGWGAKAVQEQAVELLNSEDVAEYEFGKSVAISGDTIAVGAPLYRDYVQNAVTPGADGAVFIFQEPTGGWASDPSPTYQTATLVGHEAEEEQTVGHLGESVALGEEDGEQTVVAGAPGEPVGTEFDKYRRGIVFLFNRPSEGWVAASNKHRYPESKLTVSGSTEFAELGASVSISDGVIAVGSPKAEGGLVKQGAAYVFTAPSGGWGGEAEQNQAAELTNPGGSELDEFGRSVAVDDGTIAVAGLAKPIFLFAMPSTGWSGELQPASEYTAGHKPTETGLYSVALAGGEAIVGNLAAGPPEETGQPEQGAVDVVPFAPLVSTGGTSGLSEVAARIEGSVNPDQTTLSSCRFQYGASAAYGEEAPCSSFPTVGLAPVSVSTPLTGLASGTTYHYRALASNAVDTSYGEDKTFVTVSSQQSTTQSTTTSSSTPTTTSTSATVVTGSSRPQAIEEVLLGCSKRQLVLNDVFIQGGHVALSGAAAKSLVGKTVKILFNEGKQVASATIGANGQFATTAPLPPARIRNNLTTRYSAEVGKLRSLHLKLTRRLQLDPPTASGRTVLLSGVVTLPLTKPVAPVVVEQQLECGKTTIVKTFRPPASGRFHVTVSVPGAARAGIYTLKSKVAANRHATSHGFTTYSLPLPVTLR